MFKISNIGPALIHPSKQFKETIGELTFSAATDGNHGLGVAWASMKLGQKAVIYLPKGTVPQRIEAIRNTGAKAVVIDGNYDDAVEKMARDGENEGWQVISDTAWEGYQDIPTWIMQGYTVLFDEAMEEIKENGGDMPTHIILQAGVGSFSASGVGYFNSIYGKKRPISIIVEPDNAACFYESMQINDGKLLNDKVIKIHANDLKIPGAVYIYGLTDEKKDAKISLSGPLANMIVAVSTLALFRFTFIPLLAQVAYVSAFIGVFNLLPFGPLDGSKIFKHEKMWWIALMAVGVIIILTI